MSIVDISLVLENGEISERKLDVYYKDKRAFIDLFETSRKFEARNYFSCLNLLREYLETDNRKILVNGARYDVYPSRMSLQMSNGLYAYKLVMGKQALKEDLVNIFDLAPLDKVVTIKEQQKYFENWVNSLG